MVDVEAVVVRRSRRPPSSESVSRRPGRSAPGCRRGRCSAARDARRTGSSGCRTGPTARARRPAPRRRCRASRRPTPRPHARRCSESGGRGPAWRDLGVRPRHPDAAAVRAAAHQVRHVHLRRQPDAEAGEVRVLRRRDDAPAARHRDRDRRRGARTAGCAARAPAGTSRCRSSTAPRPRLRSPRSGAVDPSPIVTSVPSTRHCASSPTTIRFPCSPAISCSSTYCAWLVSWYSSTSTWRKRRLVAGADLREQLAAR